MHSTELPRLPTRKELLQWLADEQPYLGRPPSKFDLVATEPTDDPPDLLAIYLKRRYGFQTVEAHGWNEYHATSHGVTVVFDAADYPPATGYNRAMEIASDVLGRLLEWGEESRHVDLGEMVTILERWDNPHAAAYSIVDARKLAATRAG